MSKKTKNYIIYDTESDRSPIFTEGVDLSIDKFIENVIEELMVDLWITHSEACDMFRNDFIVCEIGEPLQINIETVVTIK